MLWRFQYPIFILIPETLESPGNCSGLGCIPHQIIKIFIRINIECLKSFRFILSTINIYFKLQTDLWRAYLDISHENNSEILTFIVMHRRN